MKKRYYHKVQMSKVSRRETKQFGLKARGYKCHYIGAPDIKRVLGISDNEDARDPKVEQRILTTGDNNDK